MTTETAFSSLARWAQQALTISAAFSMAIALTGSVFWFLLGDEIAPYLEMPDVLARQEKDMLQMRGQLAALERQPLQVVEFKIGIVVSEGPLGPSGTLRTLWQARRNISCDVWITPVFRDVATNQDYVFPRTRAIKAPVTEDFILFPLQTRLPDLPPGRYVYAPRGEPIDCGVYTEYVVPPTNIFEVRS